MFTLALRHCATAAAIVCAVRAVGSPCLAADNAAYLHLANPFDAPVLPPHDASADGLRGPRHEVVPASANETPADLSISDVEGAACTAEPHRHGAIAYPGPPQEYFEIDYLFWGLEGARVPTLLTSNPTGTALRDVGNPAAASTTTLLGNQSLGDWGQSGVRLRWGKRLQDSVVDRLEMSLWMLFEREDDLNFASNGGDPMLARPFTNSVSGLPDAQVISMAGVADGSFNSNYSRQLYGIDPLAFFCVHGNACESLDVFSGYRYFHYEDRLDLTERVMLEPGGVVAPGTELLVEDQFEAHNDYHLLPLGVNYARRNGAWRLTARASAAIGWVDQEVAIRGRTTGLVGGVVDSVEEGGFLALPSNIGVHKRSRFAWIPELNLRIHRGLRDGLWIHAGYTLMYLSDVARAPDQIDTVIDPNQLPPAAAAGTRPAFNFASHDEWVHGLNAGLQWNY